MSTSKVQTWYSIVDVTPDMNGDNYRLVEIFDTRDDAESVLLVLESVNVYHNLYKIIEKEIV